MDKAVAARVGIREFRAKLASHLESVTPIEVTRHGDFQESCHSLAAIQATCINVNSRASSFSSGGLFIHTSAG